MFGIVLPKDRPQFPPVLGPLCVSKRPLGVRLGRYEPNFFRSHRAIDSLFCRSLRSSSAGFFSPYQNAGNGDAPLPVATIDALNDAIFDPSIFHTRKPNGSKVSSAERIGVALLESRFVA
jgi:hypothetical protein